MSGETTPKVRPATLGSSFGSPYLGRPPRSARQPFTAGPGSMSRSTSRARPPLHTHNSTGAMLGGTMRGREDDDEVDVEDRGEALIRQRQKERKRLRKAKERDERPGASRSVSRTRLGRQSSDYYGSVGTETPLSPRDERRPSSIYSSAEEEETASIIEDVVQEVLDDEMEDMDEDMDENTEGDEGVTLKDRQDVSRLLTALIQGYQYRTSFRFAHLETCLVP